MDDIFGAIGNAFGAVGESVVETIGGLAEEIVDIALDATVKTAYFGARNAAGTVASTAIPALGGIISGKTILKPKIGCYYIL